MTLSHFIRQPLCLRPCSSLPVHLVVLALCELEASQQDGGLKWLVSLGCCRIALPEKNVCSVWHSTVKCRAFVHKGVSIDPKEQLVHDCSH